VTASPPRRSTELPITPVVACAAVSGRPVSAGNGLVSTSAEEVRDLLHPRLRIVAGRAVLLTGTPFGEAQQRLLESDGLSLAHLGVRQRRVDSAVEHEFAHPGGEQLRVGRSDERPVGLAEVVQLLVADQGPQDVEIAPTNGVPMLGASSGELVLQRGPKRFDTATVPRRHPRRSPGWDPRSGTGRAAGR
jgi:hypothetical protein